MFSPPGPANLFGADARKPILRDFNRPIEFPKVGVVQIKKPGGGAELLLIGV